MADPGKRKNSSARNYIFNILSLFSLSFLFLFVRTLTYFSFHYQAKLSKSTILLLKRLFVDCEKIQKLANNYEESRFLELISRNVLIW